MRVVINSACAPSYTFYDDESALTADGAVAVTVVDAAGQSVFSGPATLAGAAYSFALPPQAQLSYLTVTWSGTFAGVGMSASTYVEVVGGRLFSLAELRASDTDIASTTNYPTALLSAVRDEVEAEFERITRVSFFPRYRRVIRDGQGLMVLVVPDNFVRKVRSIQQTGFPAYTTDQLASVLASEDGGNQLVDISGGLFFFGDRNVTVEYEYGFDAPPADVKRAALTRARSRVTVNRSAIPDRATSFTAAEGGTYSLSTPGRNGSQTGIPDVDAVLMRYSMGRVGIG